MDLLNQIREIVKRAAGYPGNAIKYQEPLVATVSAHHPGFYELKSKIMEGHLLPTDLLPTAQTVIVFFLPFQPELTRKNRGLSVAREWAEAYIETNRLIQNLCQQLHDFLAARNIDSAWQKPTHNFDEVSLVAPWSHKSVAYIAGLGTFGVHRMLITPAGSSGRFGSIVINAELEATNSIWPLTEEFCLHFRGKRCLACVKKCPSGALDPETFNRGKCYKQLLQVNDEFPDLALSDVCGKCLLGPCAHKAP